MIDEQPYQQLRDDLEANRIKWKSALDELQASKRNWKSQAWKRLRAQNIKDHCEQCGSQEGRMVLQHIRHTVSFAEACQRFERPLRAEWNNTHPLPEKPAPQTITRWTCPQCGKASIYHRKGTNDWRCSTCKTIHEKPNTSTSTTQNTPEQYAYEQKIQPLIAARSKAFHKAHGDTIAKQATLALIDEATRYMTGTDTVTFCDRCAYLWDIKGQRLCSKCHTTYHPHGYAECWKCRKGK